MLDNMTRSEFLSYILNLSRFYNQDGSFQYNSLEADEFGSVLYSIVVPCLFGFVTFSGVIGNSLVIYIICSKRKMRTLTNLLLLNLAFADLLFVVICPPFTAYQFATYHWPMDGIWGDYSCKIMHYLVNVTAYVTVYTLVLIAALRYFTIVHSAATVRYRTKSIVALLVLCMWLVVLLVNIPIIRSYGVEIDIYGIPDCEHYSHEISRPIYATFFTFAYVVPLGLILFLSVRILRHISSSRTSSFKGASRSENRKQHASCLLITVVTFFAITWLPVHIHLLLAHFRRVPHTDVYRTISVFFHFFAFCNSCVNPFIYNFASQDFRASFKEALCCCKRETHVPQTKSIPLISLQKPSEESAMVGDHRATLLQVTRDEKIQCHIPSAVVTSL